MFLLPKVLLMERNSFAVRRNASGRSASEPVENGVLDHSTVTQMLGDDPFEEFGGHVGVPDALRIDGDNRPLFTDAKARRFGPFDAIRVEEEIFALEQPGELTVNGATATVG
jgi:hypothetical protein